MSIFTEFKWKQKVTSLINQILGRTSSLERTAVELADEDNDLGLRISELEDKLLALGFKTGQIIPYAGTNIPDGYFLCNGANVSRTEYAELFAKIGTLYGAGDGSTTFTLPDVTNRFLEGGGAPGTKIDASIPNITGYFGGNTDDGGWWSGCFYCRNSGNISGANGTGDPSGFIGFDASRSSAIYKGGVTTVQPAALRVQFIIKY